LPPPNFIDNHFNSLHCKEFLHSKYVPKHLASIWYTYVFVDLIKKIQFLLIKDFISSALG